MSVVPLDYPGLSTKLYDTYIEPEIITVEEEDDTVLRYVLIIGGCVVGLIFLCCGGYYLMLYCANRVHKVSYIEEFKEKKDAKID